MSPILVEHCASCHRPGGPAPFSLITYDDVRPRAVAIAEAVNRRHMPPWLPSQQGEFVGERRLSDRDIACLRRWIEDGARAGDLTQIPPPPRWPSDWQLGPPDLVLEMPDSYVLEPGERDVYRNFVIPVPITTSRYVRAIELSPDHPRVVHHATVTVDRTRWSRYRDEQDPRPGYDGMLGGRAESPDGHFLAWTPGRTVTPEPDDLAWRLDPGVDLVVQLHLTPEANEIASVRVRVGLYFTNRVPTHVAQTIRVGPKTLDIAAGRNEYVAEDEYVLPVDVDLLSIYPHAHYLARTMEASVRFPNGGERRLLDIPAWDAHWQEDYRFVHSVRLPRGTAIRMRFVYDNSAANPHNPRHPPVRVVYGPRSTDEMADLWLQVLPATPADRAVLRTDFARRETLADVAGFETLVRERGDDAPARVVLGTLYSRVGRVADAERQYHRAIALMPEDWLAHYSLGVLLQAQARLDEARREYDQAERGNPAAAEVQLGVATLEAAGGRIEAAIGRYRRALQLWPEYADAHVAFGTTLAKGGRAKEAIAEYRAAVAVEPDHVPALNNLAILLAETGAVDEAVRLLRHAVEIAPDDATSRKNLAAALGLAKTAKQ